jgi:hypothetical protein
MSIVAYELFNRSNWILKANNAPTLVKIYLISEVVSIQDSRSHSAILPISCQMNEIPTLHFEVVRVVFGNHRVIEDSLVVLCGNSQKISREHSAPHQ